MKNSTTSRLLRGFMAMAVACAGVFLLVPAQTAEAAEPWLDTDFESNPAAVFDGGWGVNATSNGHVGNGVVSNIPAGNHWGSSAHWYTSIHTGSEPEEMWMRYYLQFPEGFTINEPYRGKLPGFGGLYTYNCLGGRPSTASAPCWSARMSMSPLYVQDGLPDRTVDPDEVTRIGWYAYLLNGSDTGQDGAILNWDPNLSTLDHGEWYCIEGRIAMNTLGESDGVLEGYVNSEQAFSASNLRFRRESEDQVKVKSLWFDVYYGGTGTSPRNNSILFDSLAIGPDRIGCSDSAGHTGTFTDDDDSVFENDIEKLAASGITKGCNPPINDRFCPAGKVTRGQMAAFLDRALRDELDVSLPAEPDPPPDFFGGTSGRPYKTVLDQLNSEGVGWDTYVLRFTIDQTGGDRDWLSTGLVDNPNQWVPQQLDHVWSRGATPYIQLRIDDLGGLRSGVHDQRVKNMLSTFRSWTDRGDGRRLILDILPEANNNLYAYGDDPVGFKDAFGDIVQQARSKLGDKVRIAFTQSMDMRSTKYSQITHGYGGFGLWWPGSDLVDLAGIAGYSDTNAAVFDSSFNEFVGAIGTTTPLFVSMTGRSSTPDEATQMQYLADLVAFTQNHPQMLGVQWNDASYLDRDMRVTSNAGVDAGYAAAVAGGQTGGIDWLFSSAANSWASARSAINPFTDTASSVFVKSINWLAASGITKGCAPDRYCPDAFVTRGQMAAFLTRALSLPKAPADVGFSDTGGHLFEDAIARLAHAGITKGCGPGKFCPDSKVTRGQMAAFLVRAGLTS